MGTLRFRKQKPLLITLLAGMVASLLVVGAYQVFARDLASATASDFEKSQKLFTGTATNEIERYFYDVQKRLEIIALMPNVREAQRSESCNQQLQALLEANSKEFSNLGRIDKNGMFVCAVNRTIVGEPASKYGNYFETIAKDPQRNPVMSPLILPTGSGSPVIAVHVPVFDSNGQFSGTIGGAVYFDELQSRILLNAPPTENSIITLYDNNLDILYHPDPLIRGKNLLDPEIFKAYSPVAAMNRFVEDVKHARPGTVEYELRASQYRTVYREVKVIGRNWTVAVATPKKDIKPSVQRQTAKRVFVGVGLLFAITAGALAWAWQRPAAKKPKANR